MSICSQIRRKHIKHCRGHIIEFSYITATRSCTYSNHWAVMAYHTVYLTKYNNMWK